MSFEIDTAADNAPVQGDLLGAEPSPLELSLTEFVAEFGDELLESSTAPTHRSTAANPEPIASASSPASSAGCFPRRPRWSMPPPNC